MNYTNQNNIIFSYQQEIFQTSIYLFKYGVCPPKSTKGFGEKKFSSRRVVSIIPSARPYVSMYMV
mgnify:CR=1 FL=1